MKRIELPRLAWKRIRGVLTPCHRKTWTEHGVRRERTIVLKWEGDPERLTALYWACEANQHPSQAPAEPAMSWRALVVAWRSDPRVQKRLSAATKAKYRAVMDGLLEKNAAKDVRQTTRQHVRAIHSKLVDTPAKADRTIKVVRLLWNYGRTQLDWPIGDNPAAGIQLFGNAREFEPWPEWLVGKLDTAPPDVRTLAEIILGTGQRPNAAASMRWDDFSGEWVTVTDEKRGERFEVFCPARLRDHMAGVPKRGAHIFARNLTAPKGYAALERQFRGWRAGLGPAALPYSLHGLRKLAIVRRAEDGWSDAELQALTNQSPEMVAYYRGKASRKAMSRKAQTRGDGG